MQKFYVKLNLCFKYMYTGKFLSSCALKTSINYTKPSYNVLHICLFVRSKEDQKMKRWFIILYKDSLHVLRSLFQIWKISSNIALCCEWDHTWPTDKLSARRHLADFWRIKAIQIKYFNHKCLLKYNSLLSSYYGNLRLNNTHFVSYRIQRTIIGINISISPPMCKIYA